MTVELLSGVLRALAARHHIANLKLGAENTAGLQLKSGVELCMEYRPQVRKLFVYVVLAPVPVAQAQRLAFFGNALRMNCLEQGTQGGCVALNNQETSLIYQLGLSLDGLDVDRLDAALHQLLVSHQHMASLLQSAGAPAQAAAGTTSKNSMPPALRNALAKNQTQEVLGSISAPEKRT